MLKPIGLILLLLLPGTGGGVVAREIEKQRSIYRNVVILEEQGLRCMQFETRRKRISNQACVSLENPDHLVFEYLQGILAGYLKVPQPERILIIGLGGGSLANAMKTISPEAEIINVDIDPVVVAMAKKYFHYQESDKVKTEVKDGRVYVKRALLNQQKFDWIVLDAFNGDYIPEHLMTEEFLVEVKGLLKPDGILSANTFSSSKLYHYESVTYQKVFGDLQIFHAPTKGNRVIFACNCEKLGDFPLPSNELVEKMRPFNLDLKAIGFQIDSRVDWDTSLPPLTDQYSPANLLKQEQAQ